MGHPNPVPDSKDPVPNPSLDPPSPPPQPQQTASAPPPKEEDSAAAFPVAAQPAQAAAVSPPAPEPTTGAAAPLPQEPTTEAAAPPPNPSTEAAPTPPPPPPKPPLPPAAASGASLGPAKSKKRQLESNVPVQECSYYKIRAVIKDIRPHILHVIQTEDFRTCKGADELRQRLNLLMELYEQMTGESVITKKHKSEPEGQHLLSENGAAHNPRKQLQDVKPTDQPHSGHIFAKPPEKEAIDLVEQSCYIGGSAFGWNFITFAGNKPVFYGRTKEAFRAAQVAP